MRFLKEYFAIILIMIIVIVSDIVTSNIIKSSIQECEVKVNSILDKVLKKDKYNEKDVSKEIFDLESKWKKIEENLSYFTEHDELEKVSNEIVVLKANIDMNQREKVYELLKEITFKIEHLKNKQTLKLNNLF